ncbi:MAG: ATP-binding cassette domain-containing protein [Bdellovibrionales bacterium]|nr:ATP-binding cassette domain-containing protein [Bdellovibrionales bacterium]
MNRISLHDLSFENLSLSFGNSYLIKNVNFIFPKNKPICIHGKMGAGKSSIIKTIAGLFRPTQGRCLFNGNSIYDMSFEEFIPIRLNMGFCFDSGGLLNNKSLWENIELPLQYHKFYLKEDERSFRISELFDLFELTEVAHRRPYAVSGSQRKATCLVRALIHEPEILILDDPTIGLNLKMKQVLQNRIKDHLNKGIYKFVIFTCEDDSFIESLNSNKIFINGNQIDVKNQI